MFSMKMSEFVHITGSKFTRPTGRAQCKFYSPEFVLYSHMSGRVEFYTPVSRSGCIIYQHGKYAKKVKSKVICDGFTWFAQ